MSSPSRPAVALVGPTASGKSALALAVARAKPGVEIVSVDSMQVYRGMDIGTAKPTPAERDEVRHHVIDVADPADDFSVARFQQEVAAALDDIAGRGGRALLVGGTGLYLRAVVDGFTVPGRYPEVAATLAAETDTAALYGRLATADPAAAARMEATNRRRIIRALEVTLGSGRPFSSFGPGLHAYPATAIRMIGVWPPRSVTAARIEARFDAMLDAGLVAEVAALAARPAGLSRTARQALGCREILAHLEDGLDLAEARAVAVRRTREFARRQRVWFRRDPRIAWLAAGANVVELAPALLGDWW